MKNLTIIFLVLIIALGCNFSFNSTSNNQSVNSNTTISTNSTNISNSNKTSNNRQTGEMEIGIDRTGGDYNSFDLDEPKPELCKVACQKDEKCKSWTFVKTSVQGDKARCWLKDSVPEPREDECCISGVKSANTNLSDAK